MKELAPRQDVKAELGPFVTDWWLVSGRGTVSPLVEQRGYDSLKLRVGDNYQAANPWITDRNVWSLNTPASHCPDIGLLPSHVLTTPLPHSGPAPPPAEFITSWY